jgi:site-specific DNA-methyltransferase (adenine-specific)
MDPFYSDNNITLLNGDSLELLKTIKTGSIDLVFADPPYFLSNGGITNKSGRMQSVDKGDWDKSRSVIDRDKFNYQWIKLVKRVLKNDGTIWISGTFHNIYSVANALEKNGFEILNNIIWEKLNPPPNIATRRFTHSTETILWARKLAKKNKHFFNYAMMKEINGGKQMKDVWRSPVINKSEKRHGYHPTQKPLWLLERIIIASSVENNIILDPFGGTGTTALAANKLGRRCVSIEIDNDYCNIAKKRLNDLT